MANTRINYCLSGVVLKHVLAVIRTDIKCLEMFKLLLVLVSVNGVLSQNITCEESQAILKLDKTITTKLTNPAFQDGVGILSELLNLHILLNEVSQKFKENKEKAWQIMDTLDDFGGLQLLKVPINGTRVQQVLQWSDDKVQDIKSSLMGISALWRELNKSAKEPPTRNDKHPKDINFHLEPVM